MKKGFMLVIGFWMTLSQPLWASDNGKVEILIRKNLEQVMTHLKDKTLSKGDRNHKILQVVNDSFDFSKMAKLSLGKKYWPQFEKVEKQRYVRLFTSHLKNTYIDKLDLYTDEELVVNKPVHVKKKVRILTEMVSTDNRIGILYKLYHSKKRGWQIYDVEVEGVSLISTYRAQFTEILRHKTTSYFLTKLENSDKK